MATKLNVPNRTIFCRDNLDVLRGINSETVDLIYLDPPFNSKKQWDAPIGSSAEGASFKDKWSTADVDQRWTELYRAEYPGLYQMLKGMAFYASESDISYLSYMSIRIIEMRRILKETGSLYYHCDSTMSHYVKIVLDIVFGRGRYLNEIIWERNSGRAKGSQHEASNFGVNTDSILFYSKTDKNMFNPQYKMDYSKFNKIDSNGERYYTGIPIFCSKSMGARPNLCYEWRGFRNPHPSGWRLSKERLEEEYQKGNVVINGGKLERRKYLRDYKGIPTDNLWYDIPRVLGKEGTGYPTQKPLALLERIIKASSQEGDFVLDPFCGCATACVAAERLNRQWIGIDVSIKAYELVQERLEREVEGFGQGQIGMAKGEIPVHFSTTPPTRTEDIKEESRSVYIIANESYQGSYKVGFASDVNRRLGSYQTGDPNRAYKVKYSKVTPHYREIERYIHDKFDNQHEWVTADLGELKEAIESYEPQ